MMDYGPRPELEMVASHICGSPGWAFIIKRDGKTLFESAHVYGDEARAFNAARAHISGSPAVPGAPRLVKRDSDLGRLIRSQRQDMRDDARHSLAERPATFRRKRRRD